jgi:radical SAM protein with 4Fe4S-binding SPASM domain
MFRFLKFANKVVNKIEIKLGRTTLISRPTLVDVVITKSCNLACTFCKDYTTPGSQRLSQGNFERAARQLLKTATQMNICSGGEPYLHTGLEDMLRAAKRYGVRTYVLSNGTMLEESRMRAILEERLIDQQGFSVDGIKPETVAKIRINANLDKILANVEMVVRLRKELKAGAPSIVIRYALMRSNIEELPDAVRYWGAHGASGIDCSYLSLANGLDPDLSLFYHQDLYAEVRQQAMEAAQAFPGFQLNLPPTIAEDKKHLSKPKNCAFPWNVAIVDCNGEIMPCFCSWEALRIGNIYEGPETFGEIWNAERYKKLRATVNNDQGGKLYDYCAVCPVRTGWGAETAHLGDYVWMEKAAAGQLDHRRPVRGAAARQEAL